MTQKLECYIARPMHGYTGTEPPLPNDVAIVLGTPVASRVYQDGNTLGGDTGARAQLLANEFGVKVLAWQDLGPKVRFPGLLAARNRMTGKNFPDYAAESAHTITDVLHANNLGRAVMRVHSGMGPLGTALTKALGKQPDLAVPHLAISDPVGLRQTTFLRGGLQVVKYYTGAAWRTPQEHRNDPNHPRNTLPSFLADAAVRGTTVWLTDITFQNLIDIGNNQPGTAVLLHLPGNTLNGSSADMQSLAADLRSRVHRLGSTFAVDFQPGHFHSTEYDNLRRNANFIRRTIKLSPLA